MSSMSTNEVCGEGMQPAAPVSVVDESEDVVTSATLEEDPGADSREEESDESAPEELHRSDPHEAPPPSTPALGLDGARSGATSKNTPASAKQHTDDRAAMPPPASASKASGGSHSASSLASADISACGPSPDVQTSGAGAERQGPSPGFTKKCTPQRITSAQILLMLKTQPKGAPQPSSFDEMALKAAATRAAVPFETSKDGSSGDIGANEPTAVDGAPDDLLSPKRFVQGHGTRGAFNHARTAAANAAVIAAAGAAATMEGEKFCSRSLLLEDSKMCITPYARRSLFTCTAFLYLHRALTICFFSYSLVVY